MCPRMALLSDLDPFVAADTSSNGFRLISAIGDVQLEIFAQASVPAPAHTKPF